MFVVQDTCEVQDAWAAHWALHLQSESLRLLDLRSCQTMDDVTYDLRQCGQPIPFAPSTLLFGQSRYSKSPDERDQPEKQYPNCDLSKRREWCRRSLRTFLDHSEGCVEPQGRHHPLRLGGRPLVQKSRRGQGVQSIERYLDMGIKAGRA